jgi:hypothetical protein
VFEEAHARACERSSWVLNEKGKLERFGLKHMQARFQRLQLTAAELLGWVSELGSVLTDQAGVG